MAPVQNDVVAACHLGDAVNRKAYGVVQGHGEIDEHKRDDLKVDDDPGDDAKNSRLPQEWDKAAAQLLVLLARGRLESNALALQGVAKELALCFEPLLELRFQRSDAFENPVRSIVHGLSSAVIRGGKPNAIRAAAPV
jgi:hypothetical protein